MYAIHSNGVRKPAAARQHQRRLMDSVDGHRDDRHSARDRQSDEARVSAEVDAGALAPGAEDLVVAAGKHGHRRPHRERAARIDMVRRNDTEAVHRPRQDRGAEEDIIGQAVQGRGRAAPRSATHW